jgi:hypothetical protein
MEQYSDLEATVDMYGYAGPPSHSTTGTSGTFWTFPAQIFEHVNAPIEWEQYDVSGMSSSGEALFKQAMESLKRNRVGQNRSTQAPALHRR